MTGIPKARFNPDFRKYLDELARETATYNAVLMVLAANMTDDPKAAPDTGLDRVLDALDRRTVPPRDRKRLRDAVDRADAPMKGRAGADEGLRGATGHGR